MDTRNRTIYRLHHSMTEIEACLDRRMENAVCGGLILIFALSSAIVFMLSVAGFR